MREYRIEDLLHIKVSLTQLKNLRHAIGLDDKIDFSDKPIWRKLKAYRNRYYLSNQDKWAVDLVNQGLFILVGRECFYKYVVSDKGIAFLENVYKIQIIQDEEDIYKLKELQNE